MEQQDWTRIYDDLEHDIETPMTRSSGASEDMQIYLDLDRARFAIDRGDSDEALTIIHDLKDRIRATAGAGDTRRGEAPLPTLDRLEALEDELLAEIRLGSAQLEIVGEDEVPEDPTRSASKNAKVNKSIKFEDISDEYLTLFESCKLRNENRSTVKWYSDKVIANREVYEKISASTAVPWWFVGLIHGMECSFSLSKHLHNGDSLKARTWQVPAGRPKTGNPPFTFLVSACDALEYDKFTGQTDWSLAMSLYRLERYNGFGYRKKFGTASPYLWSFTNHFTAGKYVRDGVYDPNAPSKQCGTAAMLRDLIERGIVSFEAKAEPEPPAEPVAPKPAEQPVAEVPAAKPADAEPVVVPVEVAPAPTPAAPVAVAPEPVAVPAPDAAPATPAAVPKPIAASDAAEAAAAAPVSAATPSLSPAVAAAIAELSRRSKG